MTKEEIIEMAIAGHASTRDAIRWAIKEALANEALDRKAENARELGLDYEPAGHGGRPMTLRECMEAEEPEQEPEYVTYAGNGTAGFSEGERPTGFFIQSDKRQPQPWEKFCDSNCVWTDHHPDCKLAEQKPLTWIAKAEQMPPAGVRVFWMDKDTNRVGYDTWFGDDFRFTPSHWMHIPPIEAAVWEKQK